MNTNSSDPFVVMSLIYSQKLADLKALNKELRSSIQDYSSDLLDLAYKFKDKDDQIDYLNRLVKQHENTISDLRSNNYELEAQLKKYALNDPEVKQRAYDYMVAEGTELWQTGSKIQAIKEVRLKTGWGLKDAKDFVEAHVVNLVKTFMEESGGFTWSMSYATALGVIDDVMIKTGWSRQQSCRWCIEYISKDFTLPQSEVKKLAYVYMELIAIPNAKDESTIVAELVKITKWNREEVLKYVADCAEEQSNVQERLRKIEILEKELISIKNKGG